MSPREHHLKEVEMYQAGVRTGIRFAVDKFLGQLPSDLQVKFIDDVVDRLFEEYNG